MTATPFTLLFILSTVTMLLGVPIAGILGANAAPERRRTGGAVADILVLTVAFFAWLAMQVVTVFGWALVSFETKWFLLGTCIVLSFLVCVAVYRTPGAVTVTETLDQSLSRRNRR